MIQKMHDREVEMGSCTCPGASSGAANDGDADDETNALDEETKQQRKLY